MHRYFDDSGCAPVERTDYRHVILKVVEKSLNLGGLKIHSSRVEKKFLDQPQVGFAPNFKDPFISLRSAERMNYRQVISKVVEKSLSCGGLKIHSYGVEKKFLDQP
ncbi:hypothetical protein DHW03_03210 [Pedobacter yonginense]|uniref:Uncharacterized protein n=1 Tax=Pedobacter yonginense TaxID=651869 RepID=A0A317EUB9_9SPHI|nr:hypothetical protein DHW03_03210 [Pedobacter yonginense]